MFCSGQTDTFSTKFQSLFSISRCFGISANMHGANFINPTHKATKITGICISLNSRNFTFNNLTFTAVQRHPIAFFNASTRLCCHGFSGIINCNIRRTGNARRTHTTSHNGCVRSHTAACGNNTFRSVHTANIFR